MPLITTIRRYKSTLPSGEHRDVMLITVFLYLYLGRINMPRNYIRKSLFILLRTWRLQYVQREENKELTMYAAAKLSLKKAQPIEHVRRKNTDPFIVSEYFSLLQATLKTLGLEQRPELIWNLDETSVSLDPSKTKVVGRKGAPCSRTSHGTGKEHITVLTAVSAGRQKLTPLIIFRGTYVWDTWMADTRYFELSYAASKWGWMETEIFRNYMEKVFILGLGEERTVLVVYDGHSTRVDIKVVELARKHNITILKLPPHSSHLYSHWTWLYLNYLNVAGIPKVWNHTKSESDVISVDKYDPRANKRWIEKHKMENVFQPPQPVLQSDDISPVSLHEISLNDKPFISGKCKLHEKFLMNTGSYDVANNIRQGY
ncbi:unnamed protein product [Leptidea sinapis]|uniref:DDE-1 domain-containing protein n=1 Tax=Leptidea sinapis TaxID=189913 RepID=A0A5E4QKV7_9NEOP|nr:unnamed protein product [Leptidea sinapis]